MNIIEKQALLFAEKLYNDGMVNSMEKLNSNVTSKLYEFKRDRDKLDFLKTLRNQTVIQQAEHLETCKQTNCEFIEERNLGLFIIDQEIDSINEYFTNEEKSGNSFSPSEESEIQKRLNEILEQIEKLGFGQEIIFEEIESLKGNFNIGKRDWFQLLKGKLIDLTIENILSKELISDIFNHLTTGFNEFTKQIK
jgi:hypothetical protein